jgi:anti-sigma factor RsiW
VADARLEAELARQLGAVRAPDSLWLRIHEQRRPLRVRPNPWTAWSIAGASLLVLLAGLAWRLGATSTFMGTSRPDLALVARQELRDMMSGTQKLELRSDDRGEIQRWVEKRTGVALKLAGLGGEGTELCGARIFRSGEFSGAVIAYRVDGRSAAMVVTARSGTAGPRHTSLEERATGDILLDSWQQAGGQYAVAAMGTTEKPHQPCLLCHAAVLLAR